MEGAGVTDERREARRGRPPPWLWGAYLAGGSAAVALSVVLPATAQLVLLSLVQVSGGVAVLVGVRLGRPAARAGWRWLGIGGLLMGAGAGSWFPYVVIAHDPVPYPGWSDALFVPGYLTLATGLAVLSRRQSPARDVQTILDALLLGVALAFANWVFVTGPAQSGALTGGQLAIAIVYPIIDIVLVVLVARMLLSARPSSASLWLLAAGATALLGGDTAYALVSRFGGYEVGDIPDPLWMLSLVLVGTAALHPSMAGVGAEVEGWREGTISPRLAFTAVVLQVPALVIVVALITGEHVSLAPIGAMGGSLGLLVSLRVLHLASTLRGAALTDALTGLATREVLVERMARSVAEARRTPGRAALLFLDLDDFKRVNDALGHAAGDELLVEAAARLRRLVRDGDTVVRLGGDEFAMLCDGLSAPHELERVADRLVEGFVAPFTVGGQEVFIGASIGVVALDGVDVVTVLRNADIAMYAAKGAGGSRWERFTPPMFRQLVDDLSLERELRHALVDDELVLHYQPVVDLVSGRMLGAEALVRWQHPTRGLLAPDEFVPAAEANGLIVRLGEWVLASAVAQVAEWNRSRPADAQLQMAVNLSALELSSTDLVDRVAGALARTGVDAASICLELTETAVFASMTDVHHNVASLGRLGVAIAIDDFGTRYASLTYLQQLDVDAVKIDKSFVAGLGQRLEETTIVAAVIGLAKAMGLTLVAEGVETAERLLLLREMGCDAAQGYYLSRPVPAGELTGHFDDNWCGPDWPQPDARPVGDVRQLHAVPSPLDAKRYRVLLVDDDADDRYLQRRELEATGRFDVVGEAADGGNAVQLAALHQPHLVLLDLKMPHVDGMAALPRLLLAAPGAKIVLLSGHASPGAVDRALAIGAAAFHKKGVPDLAVELLAMLDSDHPAAIGAT